MNRTLLVLLVGACLIPVCADAELLLVLNKFDHQAALVDPKTYQVLAKLRTGRGPHEAAVMPDGRYAFVANYGAVRVFRGVAQQSFEAGHSLTVLDLERRRVHRTWELGECRQPHGIAVSRDGRRVWVTCEGAKAVLELDATNGKVLQTWTTGQNLSHMLVPTPDEAKLYVANAGSGSVTVIERASGRVTSLPTGAGAEGIDVSPDGRRVWVTNGGANTVSVIDVATDSVVADLESGGQFPIRAKFTPEGSQVWVSNAESNNVVVFDAKTTERIGTVEVGAVPVGIQMSPDGARAFVANTNGDKVTVIDVAKRVVLRTFTTGNEPDGMAWATTKR
ncbi:MAG TPA: beta-propeller fold lactonase family protein [Candidatus Limnocylindria bacterium]|nr:beta-propeller fold lactonase family protein [Candidatus Limnocylindria bacterium]